MRDAEDIKSERQAMRIICELLAAVIYTLHIEKPVDEGQADEWGKHLKNVHDWLEDGE